MDKAEAKDEPQGRKTSPAIQRILDAAQAVFGERGFDGATIEEISQRAGTSKQLIYHYFDGKPDLYRLITARLTRKTFSEISRNRVLDGDPATAMRDLFVAYFDYFEAHPEVQLLTMDHGLHHGADVPKETLYEWRGELEQVAGILTRGQEAGVFADDLTPDRVYFQLFAMVIGCITIGDYFGAPGGAANNIPRAEWPAMMARTFVAGLKPI